MWTAAFILGSIVGGYLLIHGWFAWRERKEKKLNRGFKDMKSHAQRLRERGHRGRW